MKISFRIIMANIAAAVVLSVITLSAGAAEAQTRPAPKVETLPTLPPTIGVQALPLTTVLPDLVNRPQTGSAYCQVNITRSQVFVVGSGTDQVRETTCLLQAQKGVMDPRCAGTVTQTTPVTTSAITTAKQRCCSLLSDPNGPCGNAGYCTVKVTDPNAPQNVRDTFYEVRANDPACGVRVR